MTKKTEKGSKIAILTLEEIGIFILSFTIIVGGLMYFNGNTVDDIFGKDSDNESQDEYTKINEEYYKNKSYVYHKKLVKDVTDSEDEGEYLYFKLEGANPDTFEIINEYYVKDNDQIWGGYEDKELEDVDAESFEILNNNFAKDKNSGYSYWVGKIEGSEGSSFTITESSNGFAKDNQNVYTIWGEKVDNADPETFQFLGQNYSKDKDNIFYKDKIVEGADPETFEITTEEKAKDKNNQYDEGEIVTTSETETESENDSNTNDDSETTES